MKLEYLRCLIFGCTRGKNLAYCVRCGIIVPATGLRKWRVKRLIQKTKGLTSDSTSGDLTGTP